MSPPSLIFYALYYITYYSVMKPMTLEIKFYCLSPPLSLLSVELLLSCGIYMLNVCPQLCETIFKRTTRKVAKRRHKHKPEHF